MLPIFACIVLGLNLIVQLIEISLLMLIFEKKKAVYSLPNQFDTNYQFIKGLY